MRLKDHINKLEYFCVIAESKSLKAASEKALIGQPQLTKIVQQLEDLLGTTLVIRSSKGISLTKSGNQLYNYAKSIIQKANEAEIMIKSGGQSLKGDLRIGTYDSISRYFFPDFLKYMRATAPDLRVTLETGRSRVMMKKLKDKTVDIAIVVSGDEDSKPTMNSKTIYSDSFGLYQSPLLKDDFKNDLIYFPFALNETRQAMARYNFTEAVVCDNLETVKTLTEQSLGVGLLPHRVAKESILSRKLVPYSHAKIKKNDFDGHNICMFDLKKNQSPAKSFVMEEIERFLQIWSRD